MPLLDERFKELRAKIASPAMMDARRSDPVFYLVFDPSETLLVKERLPVWVARLREHDGWDVRVLSLSRLAREVIDASGQWDEWLACEDSFDLEQINTSVTEVLGTRLLAALEPKLTRPQQGVLYVLTDVEMLHPYFRVHLIETAFVNRIKAPLVVLYPGRRSGGFGLSFLGIYQVDGNYRSTLVGGVE